MSYHDRYWNDKTGEPQGWPILWTFIGVFVLLAVISIILGFVLGWFRTGANIVGPGNVTKQYDVVITNWEALKTSANNACGAQQQATSNPDSPTMIEDPAFAYAATFRKITVTYNSAMKNVFEAGLVAPDGYPDQVPLGLDQGPATDWCQVAAELGAIK